MRLICADKLIEQGYILERHGESNKLLCSKSIADIPTAYDVEAVVKQIEKFYPDAEHYGFSGAITDIIEIVRNGGVK